MRYVWEEIDRDVGPEGDTGESDANQTGNQGNDQRLLPVPMDGKGSRRYHFISVPAEPEGVQRECRKPRRIHQCHSVGHHPRHSEQEDTDDQNRPGKQQEVTSCRNDHSLDKWDSGDANTDSEKQCLCTGDKNRHPSPERDLTPRNPNHSEEGDVTEECAGYEYVHSSDRPRHAGLCGLPRRPKCKGGEYAAPASK